MSNKLFTQVPVPRFPSSTFSLSRSVMFNPRMQKLYCTNVIETLPGDGINERSEQFARTQPMVAPTFAKINADQHAFFVPSWQINTHFDDFITGGEKGDYSEKMPYVRVLDIYALIDELISFSGASEQDFEEAYEGSYIDHIYYNQVIDHVQSIIEHLDLLRAVPFILPDFIQIDESMTAAEATNVFSANYQKFTALNSHLEDSPLRVNLLPIVAYLKVWCEYFRDENLCEDYFDTIVKQASYGDISLYETTGQVTLSSIIYPVTFSSSDVDDFLSYVIHWTAILGVMPRAWKKDYFTAALPFTQKGPEVLLPLSGVFPVDFTGATSPAAPVRSVSFKGEGTGTARPGTLVTAGSVEGTYDTVKGSVSLNAAGLGSTIQDVRRAFRLEEFYEADARGGNRYPENTLSQWGVRTPDSRLPRAIFLGSNSSPVQISEVVQTSSTSERSPQGNLAGKATSYGNNRLSRYYYTMHGFLLNFYSLRVSAVYEQGIHPMFSRYDRTEYAWPRFAHLGEQPVYTKELFVDDSISEDEVFGYEPRYSEYKSEKSSVHHLLKGSLNFWTMSRRFANKPVLNEEFIYASPRLDNFQVVNPLQSPFIVEIDYRVRANRKLPFFGVPMI